MCSAWSCWSCSPDAQPRPDPAPAPGPRGRRARRRAARCPGWPDRRRPSRWPGCRPVTDPHNVYAAAGAGMLAEPAKAATPLVYVPHTRSGDVWVIDPTTFAVVGAVQAGHRAAARGPVLRPDHALRQRRPREHAHPVRSPHREARAAHPGHRPVQPLLHPGRALGDLGGRAAPRADVLRPAQLAGAERAAGPGLPGRRPRRLHPRRPHRRVHLRVRRPGRGGRRGLAHACCG